MRLEVSLRKSYGEFDFAAEFDLSGSRIGVFGPSGSGKSTLVGMLAGLTAPDAGSIRLDGETLYDARRGIHLPPERRRIGVVFQHAHLFPHLSVRRNLLYGYRRIPKAERRIDPAALCEILDLGAPDRAGTSRPFPAGSASGWPSAGRFSPARGCC